jgi:hypothetical protein
MDSTIFARKPFHEIIVEMMPQLSSAELETVGKLFILCVIPKNHEKIVDAWKKRCTEIGWSPDNIAYVADDIMAHKADLEGEKKSDNPLNRFQLADEKHA